MRLPKLTRKVIYAAAAKGKPAEIAWPANAPEPKRGHRYTLQSSQRAGENMLVVEEVRELRDGWKATVRLTDSLRPLRTGAVRPIEANPMGGPQFRAEPEPEQVDSRYQRLISEEGRIKTALNGDRQRQQAKVLGQESELAQERARGKPGILLAANIDRARRRLDEVA